MKWIKWSLSENALIVNQILLTTGNSFNPLKPNIKIKILICCPYLFSRSSGKNLLKYQLDSSSVIRSSILMTTVFYKEVILQGEIWHWSLLGLKGLRNAQRSVWRICMWILVLKGLKQAIEAHTAAAYLCLRRTIPSPTSPHPTLDGILVHHSIAPNGM